MSDYDISMIFRPQHNYSITNFLQQNWKSNCFSYNDTPRPDWGLLFVICGSMDFVYESGSITVGAGDLVFLSKDSHYKAVINATQQPTMDYLINFEIDSTDLSLSANHPIKILHGSCHRYESFFQKLMELKLREELDTFSAKSCFYGFLDRILRDYCGEGTTQKDLVLVKAKEMLCDLNDISIVQIAKRCGVSESGLRSKFKKMLGISPLQFRLNYKINRAKALLESTDMSVCDIADTLNFYDEAYFCKIFRKHVGCSPKKFSSRQKI